MLVFGGVLSDRLPRNLVLVGALDRAGHRRRRSPPRSFSRQRLDRPADRAAVAVRRRLRPGHPRRGRPRAADRQRRAPAAGNALQGMSRNIVGVAGPAIGGTLVALGSPGIALGLDAVSFVICALLLARIRIAPRKEQAARESYFHELRAGWREFTSHTWLWSTVFIFGISNMFWVGSWAVLGPGSPTWSSAAPAPGRSSSRPTASARFSAASWRCASGRRARSLPRASPRCRWWSFSSRSRSDGPCG